MAIAANVHINWMVQESERIIGDSKNGKKRRTDLFLNLFDTLRYFFERLRV